MGVYDPEFAKSYWKNRKILLETDLPQLMEGMFDYASDEENKEFIQAYSSRDACEVGRLVMEMIGNAASDIARNLTDNGEQLKKPN